MQVSIFMLLSAVCLASSAEAQQYLSSGPVPQRAAVFPGASPIVPTRVRQRPGSAARLQQEAVLPSTTQTEQQTAQLVVRQRRPQPARARNLLQEDHAAPKVGSGNVEDVYLRQRTLVATQAPQSHTTRLVTPKPVVEEAEGEEEYIEDDEESTTPESISRSSYVGPFPPNQAPTPFQPQRPLQQQQQQAQIQQVQSQVFQRPAFLQPSAFRPSPQVNFQQQQQQTLPSPQPPINRQFSRPLPQLRPVQQTAIPATRSPPPVTPSQNVASEEEEDDEAQYYRQPTKQQQKRPQQQEQPSKPNPAIRQQIIRHPETTRPYPSKASTVQKDKKPTVQTVRKYHEENEDGSITWGYENDDGSFKEETIGVDCVTRGKYGYYDPDGVKREYTYQTGIPCDKEAEAEQAASSNEGYIDYTSNQYVFPNGETIDLDQMVKNRARKPVGKYRN